MLASATVCKTNPGVEEMDVQLSRKNMSDDEDRALIAAMAENADMAAFEALYGSYRKRLGSFLFRIVKDPAVNEETFNDVMLAVWRKCGDFNGQSKVSTWIFAIAYRQCLKALKKQKPTVDLEEVELVADDRFQHVEKQQLVARAMESLSAEHRLVIELAYYHGSKYQEIAEIAGSSEATIKTRMFYARKKLKESIDRLAQGA